MAGFNFFNNSRAQLWYARLLATWCGGARTSDIRDSFLTTHRLASETIGQLGKEPGMTRKGHILSAKDLPADGIETLFDIFALWRLAERAPEGIIPAPWTRNADAFTFDDVDASDAFSGYMPDDILRAILTCIRYRRSFAGGYYSRIGSTKIERLTPSRIRRIGGRLYARCYSRERSAWRDYLISRFNNIRILEGIVSEPPDREWKSRGDIAFVINPDLPERRRRLAQIEWRISDKLLFRNIRLCDHFYVRHRFLREEIEGMKVWIEVPA